MSNLNNMMEKLYAAGKNPEQTVAESMASTGKKAIGCFPVYTPDEIIYAADMLPIGLWGGRKNSNKSSKYLQSFCCSIMKANLDNGLAGYYDNLSAVITTTYCDTLKCICEVWKSAFPNQRNITFVNSQNRRSDAGKEYLKDELRRIKAILEDMTGKRITEEKLADSISVYNDYRKACREFVRVAAEHPDIINAVMRHKIIKAAYFMDKKVYTEQLNELVCELNKREVSKITKKGVILSGLIAEPDMVLEQIDNNDLYVAGDMLVHESMQFNDDIKNGNGSAIEMMADRFSRIDGCSLLYDEEKKKGDMLVDLVNRTNAKGVIVYQLKFCDPEEFDYPIYLKSLKNAEIPSLYLEIEQSMDSAEQIRTRIQTFSEMLSR